MFVAGFFIVNNFLIIYNLNRLGELPRWGVETRHECCASPCYGNVIWCRATIKKLLCQLGQEGCLIYKISNTILMIVSNLLAT